MSETSQSENYYRASLDAAPLHPPLSGQAKVDVCIVGGGFTGLSAALHLAKAGARVRLLETETIGFGASGRNGGQIHTGFRQTQMDLERWLGQLHARDLWTLAEDAKALVRALAAECAIGCALKDGLVVAAHDRAAARELAEETEHLRTHYGYTEARMMDAAETAQQLGTDVYPAARFDSGGGHLQPLAFARGLAQAAEQAGVLFHERTRARCIEQANGGMRV
ncbi:MAG TPA: FAD-dependent oxidoreductase, partial [Rhizomicrobium sp.]